MPIKETLFYDRYLLYSNGGSRHMRKRAMNHILLILLSIVLVGCAPYTPYKTHDNNPPKVEILFYGPYPKKGVNQSQYDLNIKKMPNADSANRSADSTKTAYAVLEATARMVLKRGKRYFSIDFPEELSNTQGSKVYDLKTFQDTCVEHSILQMASVIHTRDSYACGLSQTMENYYGFFTRNNTGGMLYVMYNTPPKNSLAWDAKKLLVDMKRKDLLVPKSYDWMDMRTHELVFND